MNELQGQCVLRTRLQPGIPTLLEAFFHFKRLFSSCQFEIDGGMRRCLVDGPNKGINF